MVKKFSFIPLILVLALFVLIGCEEKETVIIKKNHKIYEYFYPAIKKDIKPNLIKEIYLPVYSHVYTSENRYEQMGITLSIRNTSYDQNLIVQEISYYNTEGKLVEKYIDTPHILKPMATVDFVVDLQDMRGGSGANFIVKYLAQKELSRPIIQAVMVNNSVNRAFGFVTSGYPLN